MIVVVQEEVHVEATYDPNRIDSTTDFTTNVDAALEFPLSLVDTSSSLVVSENQFEPIRTMSSPVRILIQPPMEFHENVSNLFNTSATSLAALGGIVTTIGTIAASFVILIRWIAKRRQLAAAENEDIA